MSTDKHILITGASQRLGAAMARAFHQRGFTVILHYYRSQQAAEALADTLNHQRAGSAHLCQGKLSDVDVISKQVHAITDRLDVLINNASSFYPTPAGEMSESQWEDLFESNAKAPLFLTQALLPLLRKSYSEQTKPSSVINMLDIHAQRPLAQHTLYCMAKAANQMMTLSLAKELAPQIRVNGIAPGAILWPDQDGSVSENYKQQTLEKIPSQRLGKVSDIVDTALFLGDGPDYITGEIISVDGGRRLYS